MIARLRDDDDGEPVGRAIAESRAADGADAAPPPGPRRDYVRVPLTDWLCRPGVSDEAKVLWAIIQGHSWRTGYCDMTNARLGRLADKSARSVVRLVAELRTLGVLEVETAPGRPNRFRPLPPEEERRRSDGVVDLTTTHDRSVVGTHAKNGVGPTSTHAKNDVGGTSKMAWVAPKPTTKTSPHVVHGYVDTSHDRRRHASSSSSAPSVQFGLADQPTEIRPTKHRLPADLDQRCRAELARLDKRITGRKVDDVLTALAIAWTIRRDEIDADRFVRRFAEAIDRALVSAKNSYGGWLVGAIAGSHLDDTMDPLPEQERHAHATDVRTHGPRGWQQTYKPGDSLPDDLPSAAAPGSLQGSTTTVAVPRPYRAHGTPS